MVFYSKEDFFEKCCGFRRLSREEECRCARQMKAGELQARQMLLESYLPMVASHIRRMPGEQQTLGMILFCCQALETAVDSFDFLQDSETFSHRLSWHLRNASVKYIAERRSAGQ